MRGGLAAATGRNANAGSVTISQLDDVIRQWIEADPGQIFLRLGIFDENSARFSLLLLSIQRSADRDGSV